MLSSTLGCVGCVESAHLRHVPVNSCFSRGLEESPLARDEAFTLFINSRSGSSSLCPHAHSTLQSVRAPKPGFQNPTRPAEASRGRGGPNRCSNGNGAKRRSVTQGSRRREASKRKKLLYSHHTVYFACHFMLTDNAFFKSSHAKKILKRRVRSPP